MPELGTTRCCFCLELGKTGGGPFRCHRGHRAATGLCYRATRAVFPVAARRPGQDMLVTFGSGRACYILVATSSFSGQELLVASCYTSNARKSRTPKAGDGR